MLTLIATSLLQDNGGCSHLCVTSSSGVICECPKKFLLMEDEKTCNGIFLRYRIKFISMAVSLKVELVAAELVSLSHTYIRDLL